jgi:hypothetical protein
MTWTIPLTLYLASRISKPTHQVLQGRVEIRTRNRAVFDAAPATLQPAAGAGGASADAPTAGASPQPQDAAADGGAADEAAPDSGGGSAGAGTAASSKQAPPKASEGELRALFASIDVDGSGAFVCSAALSWHLCTHGCVRSPCPRRQHICMRCTAGARRTSACAGTLLFSTQTLSDPTLQPQVSACALHLQHTASNHPASA